MGFLTCSVTIRAGWADGAGEEHGKDSPNKQRGGDNGLVPTSGPEPRLGGKVRLEAAGFPGTMTV